LRPGKPYFNKVVTYFASGIFSTELRCPTIPTFMAPAALPTKPAISNRPLAATSGAETAKNASPAPTVSTTVLVNAGIEMVSPDPSWVTQP